MGEADAASTPHRSTGAARVVDPLAILRDALGDDSAGEASEPAAAELPEELLTLADAADEPVPLQPRRRGSFDRRTPDAPAEQEWQEVFEHEPYAGAHSAPPEPGPDDHPTPEQTEPVAAEPQAAEPQAAEPQAAEPAPAEATQVEQGRVEPEPEPLPGEAVRPEATSLPEDEAEPGAVADQPAEVAIPDEVPTEAAARGPELTSDIGEITGEWDVAELQATVWGPLTHIDEPTSRSSEVTPMSEPTANPPDDATGFETPADLLAGYTAQTEDEPAAEAAAGSTPSTETGSEAAGTDPTTDAEPVRGELWSEPDVDAPDTEGGLWKGLRRRWHRSDTRSPRTGRPTGEEADAGGDSIDAAVEGTPEEAAVEALREVEPQAATEPIPAEQTPAEAAADAVAAETTPSGDTDPGIEPESETGSDTEPEDVEPDTGSDTGVESDTAEYEWTAADLAAGGWSTDDLRGAGWTDEQLIAVGWDPEANGPATATAEPALVEDAPAQAPAEQSAEQTVDESTDASTEEAAAEETPDAAAIEAEGHDEETSGQPSSDGPEAEADTTATTEDAEQSTACADPAEESGTPADETTEPSGTATDEPEPSATPTAADDENTASPDDETGTEDADATPAESTGAVDEEPGETLQTPEPDAQTATPQSESPETRADSPQASTSAPEADTAAETEVEEEKPTREAADPIPDDEVSTGMDQPTQRAEAQPVAPARATAAASDFEFVFDEDPIELETYDIEAPLALRRAAIAPNRTPATSQVTPQASPQVAQPVSPPAASEAPAAETTARPAPRESSTDACAPADDEGGDDESDRAAESRASAPDQPSEPSAAVPEDSTAPDDTASDTGDDTGDDTGPDDTPDGGTPAAPDPTPPSVPGAPAAETPEDTAPEEPASEEPARESATTPTQEQPTAPAPWFHDEPAAPVQPFWTSLIDGDPAAGRISPSSPGPPRHRTPEDQALPATTTAPRPPVAPVAADDSPAPAYVEYRPGNTRRWILGGLFLAAAVLAVVAVFYAVQQRTSSSMITAVSVIVLACALWWGLISWAPRIITISNGTLEVAQGPNSERFDLTSPRTEIELGGDPRARAWTAEVVRPNGSRLVIRSNQVRPQQFTELVNRYRPAGATPTPR
jgi:hypothetical protein